MMMTTYEEQNLKSIEIKPGKSIDILYRNTELNTLTSKLIYNTTNSGNSKLIALTRDPESGTTAFLNLLEQELKKTKDKYGYQLVFINSMKQHTRPINEDSNIISLRNMIMDRKDTKHIIIIDDLDYFIDINAPIKYPVTLIDDILLYKHFTVIFSIKNTQIKNIKDGFYTMDRIEPYKFSKLNYEQLYNILLHKLSNSNMLNINYNNKLKDIIETNNFTIKSTTLLYLNIVKYGYEKAIDLLNMSLEKQPLLVGLTKQIKKDLETNLDNNIILSQDNRDFIIRFLYRKVSNLVNKHKPYCIMCAGVTGTGKTLLAETVSKTLYGLNKLIYINMNEFSSSMHANRLIGSSPGYVGYSDEPLLVREIREKYPTCVILFDEIEKAHSTILDTILNILDKGIFYDSTGTEYDIKKAIIFLTTNVGYDKLSKTNFGNIGFHQGEYNKHQIVKDSLIDSGIKPEFINRIDNILLFEKPNDGILRNIAKLSLSKKLNDYNLDLSITESLIDRIVNLSDKNYGGRSINRTIENIIIPEIIDNIINKDLE